MRQEDLWHETFEDALRAVVDIIGGPKRVASDLWPAKTISEAARYLNHALDAERQEKLHLHEILWIMRKGREAGCHTAMAFLADACDYERPVAKNPKDEVAELQRQYIEAAKSITQISRRIERVQVKVAG